MERSLYADGTSRDLKQRDALSYHQGGLKPLLVLAHLARTFGGESDADLYAYTSPSGGSLRRSVEYMLPYAEGKKTHEEWVYTTVDLDRRRAAAGIRYYAPGKLFAPEAALELFELAACLPGGERFLPLLSRLSGAPARSRFPTWLTVVADACRPLPSA